jgi:hypothetical protein
LIRSESSGPIAIEKIQKSKPEETAEETAVELAIQAVEAKIRRWGETQPKRELHTAGSRDVILRDEDTQSPSKTLKAF